MKLAHSCIAPGISSPFSLSVLPREEETLILMVSLEGKKKKKKKKEQEQKTLSMLIPAPSLWGKDNFARSLKAGAPRDRRYAVISDCVDKCA